MINLCFTFEDSRNYYFIYKYAEPYLFEGDQIMHNTRARGRDLLDALDHIAQYANVLHPLTEYNVLQKDGQLKLSLFDVKADEVYSQCLFADITCHPPEYLEKNEYNAKSLVWFLGIIIYMLQFKENPFFVGTQTEVRDAILNKEPTLMPYYNKDFIELVKRLLAKNPDERPNFDSIKNDRFFKLKY
ncbi:hypothetical protein M9Y10_000252 [Tritrichomonas musculus]|uniref:Protein kinase domain-containing protein n=1 Tax=Tritrichomonas musculus TaxID=1915356 RepID=A0ABR2L3Q7_9EUKA